MVTFQRIWAMPNHLTFTIKPIAELLALAINSGASRKWIDPFANNSTIKKLGSHVITNDLNLSYETDYHLDAIDFFKLFDDQSIDGVLYDPPYSTRQVSECYKNCGYEVTQETTRADWWTAHKKEIARIVKPKGKVISFGWNSGGIGKKLGFEITDILLVPHGGIHNDTIVTVERKM